MNAFAIFILAMSISVLEGTAEDAPRPSMRAVEPHPTEMDEPALPAPEQNPPSSGPDLLPESSELPELVPATIPKNSQIMAATTSTENIEGKQRFEQIRSQAANDPHALYLLKRAKHSLKFATRRNYLRAYYVTLAERMRKLDAKLKPTIDIYERAKVQEIGEGNVLRHTPRILNRKASRRTRVASRRSHHRHHHYERGIVIEDPYYSPYYGPPVVFYPW
jgi:hypothetical protein